MYRYIKCYRAMPSLVSPLLVEQVTILKYMGQYNNFLLVHSLFQRRLKKKKREEEKPNWEMKGSLEREKLEYRFLFSLVRTGGKIGVFLSRT